MLIGGQQNIMCSESNNVFLSTSATKSSGTDFSIAAIMAKQKNSLKSESTDNKDHEITSDSEDNNLENCSSSSKSIREISKSPSIDGDDRTPTPDPVQVGSSDSMCSRLSQKTNFI